MAAWNGSRVPSESLWQSHVSVNLKLIHVHRTQMFRTDAMACTGLSLFLPRGYCSKSVEIPSKNTRNIMSKMDKKIDLPLLIYVSFVKRNFRPCQQLFSGITRGRDSGMSCRETQCAMFTSSCRNMQIMYAR